MIRIVFIFLVFYIFLSLLGCTASTMNNIMASWKGSHIDEAKSQWGTPHNIYQNELGNYVYVWLKEDCSRFLIVNGDGEIIEVDWSGYLDCPMLTGTPFNVCNSWPKKQRGEVGEVGVKP